MKRIQYHSVQSLIPAVLCAVLLGLSGGPGMQAAWADTALPWVRVMGTDAYNQPGVYGTPGTPEPANTPGGREYAASWTDLSGALWLFGGSGYGSSGTPGLLNDLWKYDRTAGNWVWVKGSSTTNQAGIYGQLGVPATTNTPGARALATSWTDSSGALWLFGGYGYDSSGTGGCLNDLWKYDTATGYWTWMKGASTALQSGTYGTLGTAAAANTPGARDGAASWTDSSGALWLFGGLYHLPSGQADNYNDLWKYEPATGNWTWMKGSNTANPPEIYGTLGVPAATNTPGGRREGVSWTDPAGKLWFFGGQWYGYDGSQIWDFNDLWKYDPATGNWTWMKGAKWDGGPPVYGTIGVADPANTPGALDSAVSWTDALGSLWLFGGYGSFDDFSAGLLNNLWKYDRSTGNWTCMQGLSAPAATPGARRNAVSWSDSSGALWLFGGYDNNFHYLNDLWRVVVPPDIISPTGTIVINNNQSVTNNRNVTLSLTWADPGGPVARMKFSDDGKTWSVWEALAASKAWTLPAGDGYKTVRVMFIDKAGNYSSIYSDYIRLDTTPPTGTILINGGASSTKSRHFTLAMTWSDGTGSGVTRMRFSIDGATWTVWETLAASKSFTLPTQVPPGYYTVRVTYRDAAGNISAPASDYIKLLAP